MIIYKRDFSLDQLNIIDEVSEIFRKRNVNLSGLIVQSTNPFDDASHFIPPNLVEICNTYNDYEFRWSFIHELRHFEQWQKGYISYDEQYLYWSVPGKEFKIDKLMLPYDTEGYGKLPWEADANAFCELHNVGNNQFRDSFVKFSELHFE